MRMLLDRLIELQTLQGDARSRVSGLPERIGKLRAEVPAPVLSRYDRLVSRGKKGVATVRNGVCGGCHLRVPVGKLAGLAGTGELHLCDNCGCHLYLPA